MELIKKPGQEYEIVFRNIVIGELSFYIENQLMHLNNLLIHEKLRGKGLGRGAVQYLMDTYEVDACGDSTYESIGFWDSIGVEFEEHIGMCKKGETLPFTLYC